MKRGHVLLLLVCGTLLLWGVAAYLAVDPRPPTREVVLTEWRAITDQDRRLRVAKELHERGHLIGMTPDQVVAELGKPNNRNLPGYGDIKYIVAPSMVDDLWLCIYVEGGKVVSTAIQSD